MPRVRGLALFLVAAGLAVPNNAMPQAPTEASGSGRTVAAALRARGLELGYNLDYEEALAAFDQAIAADPTDPAAHRLAAATVWIHALFSQGAITADDYLGQAKSDVARQPVAPEIAATFQRHIDRALSLAEQRLRADALAADAHFQVGAAYGYLTTYKATIEGRVVGSLRTARRAYSENERALTLDPHRRDAGLTVGIYRYTISTLSAPLRLLAGIAGFGGGRERGLRLIEDAAAYPSDTQTNARFTLIVIYNREQRYDAALQIIRELQQAYPRNRLLWLEAANTALRAGRYEEARRTIEDGMKRVAGDPRARAYGEDARWRYAHGAALVGVHEVALAEGELRTALTLPAPEWLSGRAHKELGKIADLSGDRAQALNEYRTASRICRDQHDSPCADEVDQLMVARYR